MDFEDYENCSEQTLLVYILLELKDINETLNNKQKEMK
jgi:hypothetical protein